MWSYKDILKFFKIKEFYFSDGNYTPWNQKLASKSTKIGLSVIVQSVEKILAHLR